MPSSHICKPAADILSDYVAAVRAAETEQAMSMAKEQAMLEFRCSWGLSRLEAAALMSQALVLFMIQATTSAHKEVYGSHAPEHAPASDFI